MKKKNQIIIPNKETIIAENDEILFLYDRRFKKC